MKNEKKKGGLRKCLLFVLFILIGAGCITHTTEAGLADSPYVTFSPDGNAFTTNADETDIEWYEEGYTVYTGETSSLREPGVGEHVYTYINNKEVTIGKWEVMHKRAACIHDRYQEDNYYYGVYFTKSKCLRKYYSGWMPYCADCNQIVADILFYMSDEAAASIGQLDMSLAYYYRCPWCMNLEQGVELQHHVCQKVSANQYTVRYHANFGKGYMAKSVHMYNNATSYEGRDVTPQKNLNLNSYVRIGYEFAGWNTEIDGSGRSFQDGEEIYNLCEEEQDSIILYAQWKKSSSVLTIDPNGGMYKGNSGEYSVSGEYGSSYVLDSDDVEAPSGARIHFNTNGGTAIPDLVGEMEFAEWSFLQPLQGTMEENIYQYTGTNGSQDYVKIIYRRKSVLLPEANRDGYSFGGWYYDKEGTKPVGDAGDSFLPTKDITLYAQWVDLRLTAVDNYTANSGKGAVNLSWKQSDNQDKTYLLYQKQENTDWVKIHSAEDVAAEKTVSKKIYYTGKNGSYVIPYSGYYRLTLCGAQGGDYGSFSGGKGGETMVVLYFVQGEVLNCVVGGQNGYNGGGLGSLYGNGGGYTSVSVQRLGTVSIAGGGGGATSLGNGQAGGSSLCNISGNQGQNGAAGGGGGYRGGACGVVNVHEHSTACKHVHVGSPDTYGGCYTVKTACGGSSFVKEKYKEIFYYGNIDNDGNHVFCVRCGSYSCPGHRDIYYHYRCTSCDTTYDSQPQICTAMKKYDLGCGDVIYVCGYEEGQILSSQPAYGGSSYVKTETCIDYLEKQGINTGNGSILIEAVHIGFQESNYLNGVTASDYAAPLKIDVDSVKISAVDENKVNISFARPEDKGTTYYHKAESYNKKTDEKICESNITVNTLISGVTGYRYCLNTEADYTVTFKDQWYAEKGENPYIGVNVGDTRKYLHIAAQDKAGNLSGTIHISVSSEDVIFWPVITEKITIKETENVYKHQINGEDIYYVKADGTTPFIVSFMGKLCGTAQKSYQINQLHYLAQDSSAGNTEGILKVMIPMRSTITAGSYSYNSEELQKQYENALAVEDASFTQVRRSDYCKRLDISQAFKITPESDGHKIRLTPGAGVVTGAVQVMSDKNMDMENSIYLLADGKGPEISGLEIPETESDETAAAWEYTLSIDARDTGSGLKEFWLEIRNTDNGGYEMIRDTDGDGKITLQISSEKALFLGKFSVLACAVDHVGNESSESYGLDGIALNASIEKERPPQSNVFKKGESGILYLQALGCVERVEVLFPEEWTAEDLSMNRVFTYTNPDYMQTEEIRFTVPVKATEGTVNILVKAYKGDKMVQVDPELLAITVEGSILDELRTRLR